ncbi:NAD(P)-dependent oxidoreductase [Sphingobacterium sp. Mn56C]|uniref:NAD(P)-dependent oxidoreductase n=1 Tax=Sphingobacterium sp. Mn56C TaxID=3395261 RepID=UPI003BBCDF9F
MKKIGWIGFGNMGKPMARNLFNRGHMLKVYRRQNHGVAAETEARFTFTDSLAELTNAVDYIFLMLPDDTVCTEIVGKLIKTGLDGKIIVNMSTISVATAQYLAQTISDAGSVYIEAPVSGSVKPAEAGNLVILAAGPEKEVLDLQPLFDILGNKTIYLGAIGQAAQAKIGINYYMSVLLSGLADTLVFMENKGIDNKKMLEVINAGACASSLSQIKGTAILEEDYSAAFPLKYMVKDLHLAKDLGLNSALSAVQLQAYAAANTCYAEEDLIAIHKYFRQKQHR